MKKKINLYLMCLMLFLQNLVFYSPVGTLYRQSRGLNMYQIFILESIFMILMIVLEIPWGFVADRIGYKKTLITSYFIFMLSKIVFYKANSFGVFLLEVILLALAISGISGCDSALIYSSIEESDSEKAFSMRSFCGNAGFFTASLLSTIIVKKSMDFAVFLTIIPYILICFCTLFLKDTEYYQKGKAGIKSSFKNVKNNKTTLIFIISACLLSEVWRSVVSFLNQPQYMESGIPIEYFGLIAAVMSIIAMLSGKAYKFSKKFGQGKVLITIYTILMLCTFTLTFTKNPILSITLIAIIEGAYSICGPLHSDIENKSITTKDRATILSIYAMVSDLGGAGVNFIIGKASNISLTTGFLTCSILCLAAIILLIVYYISIKNSKYRNRTKTLENNMIASNVTGK